MKRVLVVLFVASSLAASVCSQDIVNTRPLNFYLGAGVSIPTSDLNTAYKLGLGAVGGVGFSIPSINGLQVVPRIEFQTFGADKSVLPSGADPIKMLSITGNGRYAFGGANMPLLPYVTGGLGLAFVMPGNVGSNKTKFTYNFGAGGEYAIDQAMSLFVEARYVGIPVTGGSFNFIPIMAGLRF